MQKQPSYFFSMGPEKLIWTWKMQREGGLGKMQGSDPFFVDATAAALRENTQLHESQALSVSENTMKRQRVFIQTQDFKMAGKEKEFSFQSPAFIRSYLYDSF